MWPGQVQVWLRPGVARTGSGVAEARCGQVRFRWKALWATMALRPRLVYRAGQGWTGGGGRHRRPEYSRFRSATGGHWRLRKVGEAREATVD